MQNDKDAFEENKKEFQKSIEISKRSKERFKIEENTLKEGNKLVDSSKSREKKITIDNATKKNSDSSNRNNNGAFKDKLKNINQKRNKRIKE